MSKRFTIANCLKSSSRIIRFRILGQTCSNSRQLSSDKIPKSSAITAGSIPPSFLSCRFKHDNSGCRKSSLAAFTLVEAMISLGIMVVLVAACLTSIVVNQVSTRKAKEEAIAMDFLTKYAETVKALPFTSVVSGQHINNIYDGVVGPLINIPPTGVPVAINNAAYELFYPDLLWFKNRNPQMTVTLTPNSVSGVLHDIIVNVKLNWDPPLSKGGLQEVQVDFLKTKDVPTL